MTNEEFRIKMKELGWNDEDVDLRISNTENHLKKYGFALPLEVYLRPAPILNTSLPVGKHPEIY